jgi:hypothetical protein
MAEIHTLSSRNVEALVPGQALVCIINERGASRVALSIVRAADRCSRSQLALVVEIASPQVNIADLRADLMRIMTGPLKPLALSVVVHPSGVEALHEVSLELAMRGIILGNFTDRAAAVDHALCERRLALLELPQ